MTLKKILLTACFCGCLASALAQKSDILMLQKHQRTITNYYAGSNISFFTTDRMPVSGVIDSLKRDSLFLTQYDVRRFMTAQGASYIDTTGKFRMAFSVANIGYFPYTGRQPQSFWGRLLMLGGGGFLLVNMVNTLRVNEPPFGKDNLPRVLGALGAVAFGGRFAGHPERPGEAGRQVPTEIPICAVGAAVAGFGVYGYFCGKTTNIGRAEENFWGKNLAHPKTDAAVGFGIARGVCTLDLVCKSALNTNSTGQRHGWPWHEKTKRAL